MRFDTDIDLRTKKSVTLDSFLGVDFSSAITDVSTKRAPFAKNLIGENGENQKRPGWKELFDFNLSEHLLDTSNFNVNGVFKFKLKYEDKIIETTIAHVGTTINVIQYNKALDECILCANFGSAIHISNIKSHAFISNNRIYIIGGGFVVLGIDSNGKYFCRNVLDDDDTYIPTTTTGIECNEKGNHSTGTTLDEINLLQSKRMNGLVGADSSITPTVVKTKDDETGEESTTETKYYTYTLDNGSVNSGIVSIEMYVRKITSVDTDNKNTLGDYETIHLANESKTSTDLKNADDSSDTTVYGKVDYNTGVIYFDADKLDLTPEVEDNVNITVTYVPYSAGSEVTGANEIRDCQFGQTFGINGRSDVLFLSGNPDYPNSDFYSDTFSEDFTYFPAGNQEIFGSTTYAVKAYSRISDGTLAVIKEPTISEPTIYYRKASTETITIGSEPKTKVIFPVSVGAIGEGAVNAECCANLTSDNIFVSPNGIFGLVLADNIVANERYARERDRYIHSSLIKHDLTNAVGVVFKGRYFLAVDDVCYIMDSRYKSTVSSDKDDTYNYECWYWDNFPATCFCVYQNELYFGTSEGKFCKLESDVFEDKSTIYFGGDGVTTVNIDKESGESTVTVSTLYKNYIEDGAKFRFRNRVNDNLNYLTLWDDNNYLITEDVILEKDVVDVTDYSSLHYKYNCEIQLEHGILNESDFSTIKPIVLKIIANNQDIYCVAWVTSFVVGNNYDYLNIRINKTNFIQWLKSEKKLRLCNLLNYQTLYVANPVINSDDGVDFQLKYSPEDEDTIKIFKIIPWGSTYVSSYTKGEVEIDTPVVAEWYSPVLDLGLNDYSKTIDSLTVALDPSLHGKVEFGYETKKVTYDLIAKQIESAKTSTSSNFFDFEDIDFNNFTFDTAFASSYTKRIRERNINYIMFKVKSSDNKNFALLSLKASYVLYKKNRGVR